MNPLTLITATLPSRSDLLAEMLMSVACQTLAPGEHLMQYDHDRRGPVAVCNDLAARVVTEWIVPTADDDLYDPVFVETLTGAVSDEADVFWPLCRVEGARPWWEGITEVPDFERQLREENFIPATAAIRKSLWDEVGGYREPDDTIHEDWDFWVRCLDVGARFQCVPVVCWTYRFGPWPRRSLGQI